MALLAVGGISYLIGRAIGSIGNSGSSRAATSQSPTTKPTPTLPADPSASALTTLGLKQSDVTGSYSIALIPHGNQVAGQATLDLCNGTYPSEKLRRARLQVAAVDQQGDSALSTEAVLYATPADAAQAIAEVRAKAASCPNSPVVSPVGEPTVTTKFNAPPDGAWPSVPGVDRAAYDFVTTDSSGKSSPSVAVYLRRGRALLGIYFPAPDTPPSIGGQNTIEGVVNLFATRMAQLPTSVTGG